MLLLNDISVQVVLCSSSRGSGEICHGSDAHQAAHKSTLELQHHAELVTTV